MNSHLLPLLRPLWLAIVPVVLVSCGQRTENERPSRDAAVLQVETLKAAPEAYQQALALTGSLSAEDEIRLRPEMSGMVEKIHFEDGQQIARGDEILTLRNADFRARLSRSEAELKLAEATASRLRQLIDSNAVSGVDLDQAEAALAVANAEVELTAAELAKTVLAAPFDGVIGLREVSVGDYVDSNSHIATLRRLDPLRLEAHIPERYQTYIRPGQEIEFRVGGAPRKYAGTISAVDPGIDPATRTIRLRATVPNAEGKLLPGAFVEGSLKLDEIPDAILIPSLAVVPGLREDTVYVIEDGQASPRRVVIGFRTAERVYIADGLEAGDQVILSGILQLRPGLAVQSLDAESRASDESTDPAE